MKKLFLLLFSSALILSSCTTNPEENFQSTFPLPSIPEKTIVAFGDSLTAGYGVDLKNNYPSQLQEKLKEENFENYRVINAGVSGETTAGAVRRLDWTMKLNPHIVIVEIGGNDALRGTSPEEVERNLRDILNFFQEQKIKILFVGVEAPQNLGPEYQASFNALYPQLAKEYDIAFMPLFWEGLVGKKEVLQGDGIHPTKAGYEIIVENLFEYLEPLL